MGVNDLAKLIELKKKLEILFSFLVALITSAGVTRVDSSTLSA